MVSWQAATDLVADAGFALRSFRRSPGWTCVTLLTIALGVGASTAVFSVADTFLIRPLAYRDASHVYVVSVQGKLQGENTSLSISPAILREWRNRARSIEAAAAYGGNPSASVRGDLSDRAVSTAIVDTGFLAFAGARPVLGRGFTAEETAPNGARAIMLAEGFWRRQFGGSPDVLGKAIRLDVGLNRNLPPSTIVGVMPASLFVPNFEFARPDIWLPLIDDQRADGVAVRLKPGVSPKVAEDELASILDRAGGFRRDDKPLQPRVRLSRPQDDLTFRQALFLLVGAVFSLLLIACSNVSHMLLQRGLSRERELAIRHALGAHRLRLVRQLVTESALLGLAGGALAMLIGWGALEAIAQLRPSSLPALTHLTTTRGIVPVAGVLAIIVGLTVGVFGALHIVHEHLGQSLRTGASTASPAHRRLRGTLVSGQIALSTILLAGALLLIRVVLDLERVQLGFDPRDLYEVSFDELVPTPSGQGLAPFAAVLRDNANRVFGSRNLTIAAGATPYYAFASAFETSERPGVVVSSGITGLNYVAPDYFSVIRMPLIAGRTFDDGSFSRGEVVVSASLARQLGYSGNAIGRQFRNSRPKRDGSVEQWNTVVGVAPEIVANRLDRESKPMLYRPFPGNANGAAMIVRLPRKDAGDVLRRFAESVPADQMRWSITDVREQIEQSIAEPRFTMVVLVLFALCGVVLAAVGLFGVLSYSLGVRTREIGVRITLGATRRNIAGLFVRDALAQASLGTAIGLAGVVGMARLIRTSVYGVESLDASTFVLAAVSMLLASLMASAGPLVRATRVDPVVAIRAE